MKPYVGIDRPVFNGKMMAMAKKFMPDCVFKEGPGGEIIIHTRTYMTGDEYYYKRRRTA